MLGTEVAIAVVATDHHGLGWQVVGRERASLQQRGRRSEVPGWQSEPLTKGLNSPCRCPCAEGVKH